MAAHSVAIFFWYKVTNRHFPAYISWFVVGHLQDLLY